MKFVSLARTVDQTKLSRLILLPYCTGHHWIQYIGDSHLKQTSDYRKQEIATGSESAKEKENHYKQNILVTIQVY